MRFTDRGLQALKPKAKRYVAWKDNGDGLGVRVSPQGRKTFVYMFRFDSKSRMLTLGVYGKGKDRLTLAQAQKAHGDALERLENGIDPGAEAVTERQADRTAPTVGDLCAEYIERHAKVKKRSWEKDARILGHDVLPLWGRKKAIDIRRRDVLALVEGIADRGAPIQANRTLACVRKMFSFAMERDIIDASPCAGVKAPGKENRRERVLSPEEIRTVWIALETGAVDGIRLSMDQGTRIALRLMLVTAQRKAEVLEAEWADVDLDAALWIIPGARAKNGKSHRVPLSPQALDLLRQAKALAGDNTLIFPGRRKGMAMRPDALTRAIARAQEAFDIAHWTPHDLRRTAATLMSENGSGRLVIAKVLNHVSADAGVTAVYDRHSYDAEKRTALEGLGRRIASLLHARSENVTTRRSVEN